jgi:hypothetical protein
MSRPMMRRRSDLRLYSSRFCCATSFCVSHMRRWISARGASSPRQNADDEYVAWRQTQAGQNKLLLQPGGHIGGSSVSATGKTQSSFCSGRTLTPARMVEGVKGLATPFLSAVALPPRIGCIEPLGGPSVCRRANFGMLARPHFVLHCLRSDGVSRAIGLSCHQWV